MLVTELGMVMVVNPEHEEKVYSPMLFTEFPIVTEVKPEHDLYLQIALCQRLIH